MLQKSANPIASNHVEVDRDRRAGELAELLAGARGRLSGSGNLKQRLEVTLGVVSVRLSMPRDELLDDDLDRRRRRMTRKVAPPSRCSSPKEARRPTTL